MQDKYTLQPIPNSTLQVLAKNNEPCICPFRNPLLIPKQTLGGTEFQPVDIYCTTNCPHFNQMIGGYSLTCGNSVELRK